MDQDKPKRIYRQFSPEEQARWEHARDEALALKPQLIEKGRRLREAGLEPTFSGALRMAIHRHDKPLPQISDEAGIPINLLDEFLTGERTLRSDAIDRLIKVLGFLFPPEQVLRAPKMEIPELHAPPIIEPGSITPSPSPSANS